DSRHTPTFGAVTETQRKRCHGASDHRDAACRWVSRAKPIDDGGATNLDRRSKPKTSPYASRTGSRTGRRNGASARAEAYYTSRNARRDAARAISGERRRSHNGSPPGASDNRGGFIGDGSRPEASGRYTSRR